MLVRFRSLALSTAPWLPLTLAACATAPRFDDIPLPPTVPAVVHTGQPPGEPRVPVIPASFEPALPPLPAGRMQTVDEVWKDLFLNNATPEAFPFGPDKPVVVIVPSETPSARRISLIAAFLAAGYRVKDAGVFQQSTFLVDHHPWWYYAGEGFMRSVIEQGKQPPESLPETAKEARTYRGFDGMKLEIRDPTSLWVPDLLANQNLQASYLARVIVMDFATGSSALTLSRLFDATEIAKYRRDVEALNKRIDEFNDKVVTYKSEAASYVTSYEQYLQAYDTWQRGEARTYDVEYEAYRRQFEDWRAEHAEALASAQEAETREASYRRTPEDRLPVSSTRPAAQKASLPDLEKKARIDTTQLEALMKSSQEEAVPTRYGQLLMEVIDAKNGEVVWVTHAKGVTRDDVTEEALLKELIRRLTRPQ